MPPSPGLIHSLPIKVLYSIDTSPQTYLTILNEKQDVYVHPSTLAYGLQEDEGLLGSCSLKAVARGICYASPECVPNPSTLDFSLYNLDPSIRNRIARAFPSSNPQTTDPEASWAGKGFLSWILDEAGTGNTLIKGRIVREFEFASTNFNGQGGLEGLMLASASRAGLQGRREDVDGKGWGLEIGITLRHLRMEGKVEFTGREAFKEMLSRGRESGAGGVDGAGVGAGVSNSNTHSGVGSSSSVTPVSSSTPVVRPQTLHSSSYTTTSQPSSDHARPIPTYAKPSIPIRAPPKPSTQPTSSTTPTASSSLSSKLETVRPTPQRRSSVSTVEPDLKRTPPPQPSHTGRTPPPPSPSHMALTTLLRQEGKLSPEAIKKLVSNPTLLRLIKSVPTSAGALSALRNGTGNGNGNGISTSTASLAEAVTNSILDMSKPSPVVDTPTPSNTTPVKSGGPIDPSTNLCYNCGATESDIWRTKRLKDGTQGKVCDACGLYFNKHKKMRPKELWNPCLPQTANPKSKAAQTTQSHTQNPPVAIRSSPRRARNASSDHPPPHTTALLESPSPRKRQRTGKGVMPSPRMATRASARVEDHGDVSGHANSNVNGSGNANGNGVGEGWTSKTNDELFGYSLSPTPNSTYPNTDLLSNNSHSNESNGDNPPLSGEDIEALLASFSTDQGGGNMNGGNEFDLDALLSSGGLDFGTLGADGVGGGTGLEGGGGEGGQGGEGYMSQELVDFLAGLEGGDLSLLGVDGVDPILDDTGGG